MISMIRLVREARDTCGRWAGRGLLTVLDQGLVSGSNFLAGVLFARWLAPADYGAFAVAFSIFLFLGGFHNALILEPMSVLGASRYGESRRPYLRAAVLLHVGISGLLAVMLMGSALLSRRVPALGASLTALALAMPFILLLWLLRRACYVFLGPAAALWGSVAYAAVMGVSMMVAPRDTPMTPLLLMGLASAAGGLVLWRRWRLTAAETAGRPGPRVVDLLRRHWSYGKWVAAVTLLHWVANLAFPALIGWRLGLDAAGSFRASENLLLPMQHVLAAMTLLLLPWASAQAARRGTQYLKRFATKGLLVASVAGGLYALALLAAAEPLAGILYGNDSLYRVAELLPLMTAAMLVRGISDLAFATSVRAAGRPEVILWSTAAGATVSGALGIPLLTAWSLQGAAALFLLSQIAQAVVLAAALLRITGRGDLRPAILSTSCPQETN